MKTTQEHLEFETLNDLVDGRLDARASDRANSHLAVCQTCASEHRSLTALMAATKALPVSVLPEQDIWPELKEALNSGKTLVLPNAAAGKGGAPALGGRSNSRRFGALLAAAAVVLVVLSSWLTTLVLRRDVAAPVALGRDSVGPETRRGRATNLLPANFQQAEREYNRTIDELQIAVNTQRSQLNPETVRTIDRSLAVVDSAIAEARSALLADPNNALLVDLLSGTYQRKLDLLRRTSELGSKI